MVSIQVLKKKKKKKTDDNSPRPGFCVFQNELKFVRKCQISNVNECLTKGITEM